MRAPISVIIPTLDAESGLPHCLSALGEGLNAGLIREVIFSDGGSLDSTLGIAEAAGAEVVSGPPSRGGQLRRGAEAAAGDWLLFLHADTALQEGWTEVVLRALPTPGAYHFRLRFDAKGLAPRLVSGWANVRSRYLGLPYGDQGLLIDRASYEKAGGFPDIPLMEDVALARLLRRQMLELPAYAVTNAGKYQCQGWLRRGARNLSILIRYLFGADPAQLAKQYRK